MHSWPSLIATTPCLLVLDVVGHRWTSLDVGVLAGRGASLLWVQRQRLLQVSSGYVHVQPCTPECLNMPASPRWLLPPNDIQQHQRCPTTSNNVQQHPTKSDNIQQCPKTSSCIQQHPTTSSNIVHPYLNVVGHTIWRSRWPPNAAGTVRVIPWACAVPASGT